MQMKRHLALALVSVLALALSASALATHKPRHPQKPGQAQATTKEKAGGKAEANATRGGNAKVQICHRTGSAKNRGVTITVSSNALPAHLLDGDRVGACGVAVSRATGVRAFGLLAAQLQPVAGATGRGAALVAIVLLPDRALVCYALRVVGVNSTAAHIHTFAATTIDGQTFPAGGIVVPLKTPNAAGIALGCTSVARAIGEAILANPQNFYVNVHSPTFPGGQVQGALRRI
jgi:hypothetical protein